MVNEWSDKPRRFRTVLRRSPLANPRPFRKPAIGRTEVAVLHLGEKVEKVVSSLIGADGPSARRVAEAGRMGVRGKTICQANYNV